VTGFCGLDESDFDRLAVTPEQIRDLELPTRPTKAADPRARRFAGGSVEVDAIRAPVLRQLVEDAIVQHIDQHQLEMTRVAETAERDLLRSLMGYVDEDNDREDDDDE
jgi:hypothetical protein